MPAQPHETQPHETLWALATAGFAARCLQVVADLGVADRLDDEPVPVAALAAACGSDPDGLDRVLRLLAAHGVFARGTDGYRHTAPSRLLRGDHPMSMRAYARMMGLPPIWGSATELAHSVRTARPGFEAVDPKGIWAYLQDRPAETEVFAQAMAAKAGAEVAAVLDAYDFTGFATVADIGGGRGHLLRAVLDAAPSAAGVLFDLPEVTAIAETHPRMAAVAGDFFVDALPVADAYVLMDVLHDWADDECAAILGAVHRAAPEGATLLVVECVLEDGVDDPRASTLDVIMLAVTGGRERTADQLGVLFERAGFELQKVIDTSSPVRIVEARAGGDRHDEH